MLVNSFDLDEAFVNKIIDEKVLEEIRIAESYYKNQLRIQKRNNENIRKKQTVSYYKITYPSPFKDPFYQALILYFINLRNQAGNGLFYTGDTPSTFLNDFSP